MNERATTVLVIDDEEIMREILEALLTREGYDVRLAATAVEGLDLARAMPFDAAIVDVMLPGMDGVQALDELKKIDDDLPVVMITAFASVENAIAAMKQGAFHYISKPFKNDEVLAVLRNALEKRRLVVENRALRQRVPEHCEHFVVLERLADVVERAALHRRDRVLDRRVRRDHEDREVVVDLLQLVQRLHAVHAGQHHVDDGGIERHRAGEIEPLGGCRGEADLIPLARQQRLEDLAHDLLVVDDENRAGHYWATRVAAGRASAAASGSRIVNRVP